MTATKHTPVTLRTGAGRKVLNVQSRTQAPICTSAQEIFNGFLSGKCPERSGEKASGRHEEK